MAKANRKTGTIKSNIPPLDERWRGYIQFLGHNARQYTYRHIKTLRNDLNANSRPYKKGGFHFYSKQIRTPNT